MLPHPCDSPGKNTGVGCHFLLQCMKVKSESEVVQSYPTLRDPIDYSLPGSSVHGIFQARVLLWGAIAFYTSAKGPFLHYFSTTFLQAPHDTYHPVALFIWYHIIPQALDLQEGRAETCPPISSLSCLMNKPCFCCKLLGLSVLTCCVSGKTNLVQ